ncbi:hypothetical protein HOC13_03755 [Candidatus Woesearchaeota archaeon]|nr:hypothetical protein [Candidatus Woesearchaeota archaeon]
MKKLFGLMVMFLVCFSFLVVAEADLIVEDFALRQDNPEVREAYDYILDVKNVGDDTVSTCLPAELYFEDDPYLKYPNCLLQSLTNIRDPNSEIASVKIISEDGSEKEVIPEWNEGSYMSEPLTSEEIEEKKELVASGLREYTEEELVDVLASIEKAGLEGYEYSLDSLFVELQPGETLRYESENSFNGIDKLFIPPGELNLEKWNLPIHIKLDRFGVMEDNQGNNDYSEDILMEPTIIQGPKDESSKNVELDGGNEYFGFASGCAMIQGKEICVSLDDPNVPDDEENLVISVDGSEEVYSYSGLFMAWFYKWFGDGRLAPAEVNNGVEIIIYMGGFKFSFV